jgi:hypothetical protein
MLKYIVLLGLIANAYSEDSRIKIAIVDTGVDYETSKKPYMCENGNIIMDPSSLGFDTNGHGSNIASAIGENIDSTKFCIISYQALNGETTPRSLLVDRLKKIKDSVIERNVKYINMSIQGDGFDVEEYHLIKEIVKNISVLTISAGNHKFNLDSKCDEFPACYNAKLNSKKIHIVGAYDTTYSNYGKIVKYSESGHWKTMSGTSQASALHMAKVVMGYYDIINERNK